MLAPAVWQPAQFPVTIDRTSRCQVGTALPELPQAASTTAERSSDARIERSMARPPG